MAAPGEIDRVEHGLCVRGRVQGVGFRWWTRRVASELGVAGLVWNCADGSVRIDVAGSRESVSALVDAVSTGPAGARVDSVEPVPVDGNVTADGFHIGRGAPPGRASSP